MKKLLCVILALILCFSAASAALADDTEFPALLTSVFDAETENWFEEKTFAALLTVTLSLDCFVAGGSDDDYNYSNSAVGKAGDDYCVLLPGANTLLAIFFTHGKDTAEYQVLNVTGLEEAKAGLTYDFIDNDPNNILLVTQFLTELLSGDGE